MAAEIFSPTNLILYKSILSLVSDLKAFKQFGSATRVETLRGVGLKPIPVFINEFWTAKQRAASSLHEISYRACFKPQLPRFFITRLTSPGETICDPFMGRGTTPLESAMLGRRGIGCDINPLSRVLLEPRFFPPELATIESRLGSLDLGFEGIFPQNLLVFYHQKTLRELCGLRRHLLKKEKDLDVVDRWIRMVATNRLTGHSKGFFSVYTLPPNQAVSAESQRRINDKRGQMPDYRNVRELILRKSRSLLAKISEEEQGNLKKCGRKSSVLISSAESTPEIKTGSVDLIVTSPPFLDTVNYAADNWLRCWFNGIKEGDIRIWNLKKIDAWQDHMTMAFREMHRTLKKGGLIAFEVGEVRGGKVKLEEPVISAAEAAGLEPVLVLINFQNFTKTSHCWGVSNQTKGTNTNRVVLLQKKAPIKRSRRSRRS